MFFKKPSKNRKNLENKKKISILLDFFSFNFYFFFSENQEEIGRENFSLGGPVELLPPVLEDTKSSKRFLANVEEDERKLIGWLQVRDPNNRRKTFLQVVNPKPEGPFRKAPWHGNVHVMKF